MEEQGETRKIQFTGKSSYIVSLPKQWINELGLKQGDQIRMVRKGSSTLELFPPKIFSLEKLIIQENFKLCQHGTGKNQLGIVEVQTLETVQAQTPA